MNKQKDTRYTGRYPDKKIGYLRRTTVFIVFCGQTERFYNQTSKEIYLMQKKEYHFFYPIFCVGNKLIP